MCDGCLADYDAPVALTASIEDVARLIKEWYRLPGNEVGGPLHVVLDDYNVEDEFVDPCERAAFCKPGSSDYRWHGEHRTVERDALAGELIAKFRALAEAERATAIWHSDRYNANGLVAVPAVE